MMGAGAIEQFQKRWQQFKYVEGLLYAVGFGGFVYLLTHNIFYGILGLLMASGITFWILKPWKISSENAVGYIDAHLPEAGFSSGLLLSPTHELSDLSKLQQYRVATQLEPVLSKLRPPHNLLKAALVMFGLILLGLAGRFVLTKFGNPSGGDSSNTEQITFAPKDTLSTTAEIPELIATNITIAYPAYTRKRTLNTSAPNIKAVEGSRVTWNLEFDGDVQEVEMDLMGERIGFTKTQESYRLTKKLEASGFYSFTFKDDSGNDYVSDLYSMEMVTDEPPMVQIEGLDNYTYFEFDDDKRLMLNTNISDDFGIDDTYIIATVSKGSGESVKFREETVRFDAAIPKGNKRTQLQQALDLDALKMDPGDELYFYVEALDQKTPTQNIGRSETYFAVIRDTVSDAFVVEGNLGVDLMPDYFRSQRQLIIDTEKLIADKPNTSEKDFKSRSNELGFDQKQLRLKYGQFMGDETEMQAAPGQVSSTEAEGDGHAGEEGEDLLDEYSHRHDSDNEHNLVQEQEHGHENGEEEEDPLHDYLHNHSDPEASTLFEKSLKAKLRDALNIMWDAELHLRLYEPEKSLPYQYDALKIIQDIKNSVRIYVHRIGFDPPPIKEESRLSGDIGDITNFDKKEAFEYQMPFTSTRETIARLERLILGEKQFDDRDSALFIDAGNELAPKAISEPLKYLKVLQGLRDLEKVANRNKENFKAVQKNLLEVLPEVADNPMKRAEYQDEINLLYLKELGVYE
ncbi:tryptophan-rich sensory protein [Flagellimonas halotolerans]|uniref:Tryptophan-rich sensory protein n=1 Tax=Flagellimonas halotolerans TaxID=3112164 RepID=A0ABU6ITX5_9FLAO|nr:MULTISPECIES: tryptophan-rich sensory protein [unclassified Allomuricauda]MEC3966450.1 tryptophan-rich sensory protein [Muricauda sp. SYSU M86414]MEC4266315.1 tryptophan-rich sensory protein [Muricauda sp. SYSU M84420]